MTDSFIKNLLAAHTAWDAGNYVPIEDFMPKTPSPEKLVIKQDLFSKLSAEAREVIQLIIETPSVIIENTDKKYTGISKWGIINFLRKKGKKGKSIKIVQEIQQFVNEF